MKGSGQFFKKVRDSFSPWERDYVHGGKSHKDFQRRTEEKKKRNESKKLETHITIKIKEWTNIPLRQWKEKIPRDNMDYVIFFAWLTGSWLEPAFRDMVKKEIWPFYYCSFSIFFKK